MSDAAIRNHSATKDHTTISLVRQGFIEIQDEAGDEGVGGELWWGFLTEELFGIAGLVAVMLQGAVQLTREHLDLLRGGGTAEDLPGQPVETLRGWLRPNEHLRRQGLGGLPHGLIIQQGQCLERRVRTAHADLTDAALGAIKKKGGGDTAPPEGI